MNSRSIKLILGAAVLLCSILGCSYAFPWTVQPTPFVFPTPNLTMTALFSPQMQIPPTATPGEIILPMTPTDTAVPTETFTPEPSPTFTPTITASPTQAPTIIYVPVPIVPVTVVPAPGQIRTVTSVYAPYFTSMPVIDGVWSDGVWGRSPEYGANYVVYGYDNWTGPEDLSASFKVGWDANYLYIACKVNDDIYAQHASGQFIYKGDSPEILLDADLASDFNVNSLNGDDYQIVFSPGYDTVGSGVESFRGIPSGRSTPEVIMAAVPTGDGYRLEAAVPWATLGAAPYTGKHFGFSFGVSDNDVPGDNLQQSMVSNVSTRGYTRPATWGDLTLGN